MSRILILDGAIGTELLFGHVVEGEDCLVIPKAV